MRYRVAFTRRLKSEGGDPETSSETGLRLSDGVVVKKEFVEEPPDDPQGHVGGSTEIWEYIVVDARADEFEEALQKSNMVLEYDVVDSTVTTAAEAAGKHAGQDSSEAGEHGASGPKDPESKHHRQRA